MAGTLGVNPALPTAPPQGGHRHSLGLCEEPHNPRLKHLQRAFDTRTTSWMLLQYRLHRRPNPLPITCAEPSPLLPQQPYTRRPVPSRRLRRHQCRWKTAAANRYPQDPVTRNTHPGAPSPKPAPPNTPLYPLCRNPNASPKGWHIPYLHVR